MSDLADITSGLAARRWRFERAAVRVTHAVERALARHRARHAELVAEIKAAAPDEIGTIALQVAMLEALHRDADSFMERAKALFARIEVEVAVVDVHLAAFVPPDPAAHAEHSVSPTIH